MDTGKAAEGLWRTKTRGNGFTTAQGGLDGILGRAHVAQRSCGYSKLCLWHCESLSEKWELLEKLDIQDRKEKCWL